MCEGEDFLTSRTLQEAVTVATEEVLVMRVEEELRKIRIG